MAMAHSSNKKLKHVLVVMGTPRQGNTYQLVKLVEEQVVAKTSVVFEYLFLKDYPLDFCKSCYLCFTKGESKCPHYQITQTLKLKLQEADALILASPVFALNVSAEMKNFIDHLAYLFHRPFLYPRPALAVSTTMGNGHKAVLKYLTTVLEYWGCPRVHQLGVALWGGDLTSKLKVKRKVENVAKRFAHDLLATQRAVPWRVVFKFNMWKAVSLLGKEEESADYIYWREQGWLEQDFYVERDISAAKRFIGRLVYSFLKKVML